MSNEKELIHSAEIAQSITTKEFMDFLQEKRIPNFCPACRFEQNTVTIMHNEDSGKPYTLQSPLVGDKNLGMWFFSLGCTNCGYMQLFNVQPIEVFVLAKRKGNEDKE